MVAVDSDGADLAAGETVLRLAFAAPVSGPRRRSGRNWCGQHGKAAIRLG